MASAAPTKKRNHLTLKKKVEVIKYAKQNPRVNIRDLGECGKTQIAMILKNQDSLLSAYESNASSSKVHATIASFPGPTEEEERAWYTLFAHAPHHHGNTSRGHRPITGLVGLKVGNSKNTRARHTYYWVYTFPRVL